MAPELKHSIYKEKKPTLVKDDLHIIVPRLVISSLELSDYVGGII